MQPDSIYICNSCGEEIVIPIDLSAGTDQAYVEDCPVCCHPNTIQVHIDEHGDAEISASSEQDRF